MLPSWLRKPFNSAEPSCHALSPVLQQTREASANPMQPETAPFSEITSDSDILEHAELMFKRFSTEMPSEDAAGAATSHQIPGAHGQSVSTAEEPQRETDTVNSGIRGRIVVPKRFRNRRGPLSTTNSEPAILLRVGLSGVTWPWRDWPDQGVCQVATCSN